MAGRPKAQPQLTPAQVEELAAIGCADDEIAVLAGIEETTLKRHFAPHLKKGRANLKIRVRKKQLARAEEGSDTMLIWLGKVYLGQREVSQTEISGPAGGPIPIRAFNPIAALADLAPGPVDDRHEPGDNPGGGNG